MISPSPAKIDSLGSSLGVSPISPISPISPVPVKIANSLDVVSPVPVKIENSLDISPISPVVDKTLQLCSAIQEAASAVAKLTTENAKGISSDPDEDRVANESQQRGLSCSHPDVSCPQQSRPRPTLSESAQQQPLMCTDKKQQEVLSIATRAKETWSAAVGVWEPLEFKIHSDDDEIEDEVMERKIPEGTEEYNTMVTAMFAMIMVYVATQGQEENKDIEFDTLDLCNVDDDRMDVDSAPGRGWKKVEVTVDSGAAHSVIDGDQYPQVPREESAGSKRGQVYLGPGTERIPNRGQKRFKVVPRGQRQRQQMHQMTFQDAKVRKPLAAVSGIVDKNNLVLFDKQGSFIAPANEPEVAEIRRLIKQVKSRIALEEKRGVYIMPMWIQEAEAPVFSRPGM